MSVVVVEPSADIKPIIEKTAAFVAKRGDAMEERILSQDKSSSKLSFLRPQDPLNPYYRQLVIKLREESSAQAGPTESTNTTTEQSNAEKEEQASKTEQNKATKSVPAQTQQIKPPARDSDLIKLTAMFTARNGDSFREGLLSREHQDPQYDFLNFNNINHGYYALLVEQYKSIMLPPRGLSQTLRAEYATPQTVLKRLTDRATWENAQEKARKSAEEEAEAERIAYAQIDWQDFVIVETINFDDDDDNELPAPKVSDESASRNVGDEENENEIEKEKKGGDDTDGSEVKKKVDEERKSAKKKKGKLTQICPICHLEIPIEEISEHMRIELLDPNGKKQKELGIARAAQSALASGDEISANLAQFAKSRKDIFGLNDMQKDVLNSDGKTDTIAPSTPPQVQLPQPPPPQPQPQLPQLPQLPIEVQPSLPLQVPPLPKAAEPLLPGMMPQPPQIPPSLLPMMPGMLGVIPPQAPLSVPPPTLVPPQQPSSISPSQQDIDSEPPAKRPLIEKPVELVPETTFLEENGGGSTAVEVLIVMPPASAADTGKRAEYKRLGETLKVSCTLSSTVGDIKSMVKDETNIPVNKQKLSVEGIGVLKDASTLAFYNVLTGRNSKMTLKFKERGGKRK